MNKTHTHTWTIYRRTYPFTES